MTGSATIEIRGAVAIVTLVNPARMNAFDDGVATGLVAALAELRGREGVGALVLRGEGERAFCSGMDLKFAAASPDRAGAFALVGKSMEAFYAGLADLPYPTIAMVRGVCYGGGVHLAALTDFRIGDDAVRLAIPAIKNGLFYQIAALDRLYALIGPSRTRRILLEGGASDAATLLDWGFLDQVHPAATMEEQTLAFAARIAAQPLDMLAAYARIFRLLDRGDRDGANQVRLAAQKARQAR